MGKSGIPVAISVCTDFKVTGNFFIESFQLSFKFQSMKTLSCKTNVFETGMKRYSSQNILLRCRYKLECRAEYSVMKEIFHGNVLQLIICVY